MLPHSHHISWQPSAARWTDKQNFRNTLLYKPKKALFWINSAQASDWFLPCIWCLRIMITISPISSKIRATSHGEPWTRSPFLGKASWKIFSYWWNIDCLYSWLRQCFVFSSGDHIVLGCFVLHWMGSWSMWVPGSLCSLNELNAAGLEPAPGETTRVWSNLFCLFCFLNIIGIFSTHKYKTNIIDHLPFNLIIEIFCIIELNIIVVETWKHRFIWVTTMLSTTESRGTFCYISSCLKTPTLSDSVAVPFSVSCPSNQCFRCTDS